MKTKTRSLDARLRRLEEGLGVRLPPAVLGDRLSVYLELARQALGETAKVPLVRALLLWIDKDDLAAALEECGILKAGTGRMAPVRDIAADGSSTRAQNSGPSVISSQVDICSDICSENLARASNMLGVFEQALRVSRREKRRIQLTLPSGLTPGDSRPAPAPRPEWRTAAKPKPGKAPSPKS